MKRILRQGLQSMQIEHEEEVADLLTACFLLKNQLWSSFSLDKCQLTNFFKMVIQKHLEYRKQAQLKLGRQLNLCLINVVNGNIVGCFMSMTLEQYLSNRDSEPELDLFQAIQKVGKKLMEGVKPDSYPPGTAAFATFGGIHPSYCFPREVIELENLNQMCRIRDSGIRYMLGRYSNPRGLALHKKIGVQVLKEVSFEREGKQFPLYLGVIDLTNDIIRQAEIMLLGAKL